MALDPACDVLVAYSRTASTCSQTMAFPVRVIIPRAGSAVAWSMWLWNKCGVMNDPIDNFYHFNDNRILPPEVDGDVIRRRLVDATREVAYASITMACAAKLKNVVRVIFLSAWGRKFMANSP
jgi:hypothetical protein